MVHKPHEAISYKMGGLFWGSLAVTQIGQTGWGAKQLQGCPSASCILHTKEPHVVHELRFSYPCFSTFPDILNVWKATFCDAGIPEMYRIWLRESICLFVVASTDVCFDRLGGMYVRGMHRESNISKIRTFVLKFSRFRANQIHTGWSTNRPESLWTTRKLISNLASKSPIWGRLREEGKGAETDMWKFVFAFVEAPQESIHCMAKDRHVQW